MSLRFPWAALLLMLTAVEAAGQGTMAVHYVDGKLSVQANQVTIRTLLQRVARQADFRLDLADGVGETLASVSFRDMPLEKALMELARPNDLMIFYTPGKGTNKKTLRIDALSVSAPSPPGITTEASSTIPDEPVTESEAQQLGRLITGTADLAQRRQAIADLVTLNSPEAIRELELALGVAEPELRQAVVQALGEVYGDMPPTALGQIVMGDSNVPVREAAVRTLAGLGGEVARLFIERALKDQEESVREAARIALSEMPKR